MSILIKIVHRARRIRGAGIWSAEHSSTLIKTHPHTDLLALLRIARLIDRMLIIIAYSQKLDLFDDWYSVISGKARWRALGRCKLI